MQLQHCAESAFPVLVFDVPLIPDPFHFSLFVAIQIIAYITPSSTDLAVKEVEGFLMLMKGHTEGFSAQAVSQVFFSLCNDASEGVTLPVNTLLCSVDTENHPEIAEGLARFLPAYTYDGDELSVDQFIDMHDDMHASSPDNFTELLKTVYRV